MATCAVVLAACGGVTSPLTDGARDAGTGSGSGSGTATGTGAGGGSESGASSGSNGSSGSSGTVGDVDASTTTKTLPSGCPIDGPANGAPCSKEGLVCEYGSGPDLFCDTLATCKSGAWSVEPPGPGPGRCDGGANVAECPATLADVVAGAACASPAECLYPDGVCFCAIDHTGAPQVWTCFPQAGCPYPRPRLGTSCATVGQQCDYGLCGASQLCEPGGYWGVGTGGCHP